MTLKHLTNGRGSREAIRRVTEALLLLAGLLVPAAATSFAQSPDVLLSEAAALQKAKNYAGAEAIYRQLLIAAPDDPEILKALGAVCQAQGRHRDSIEIFHQILRRAPLYPGVNGLLGVSYYSLNEFNKAIDSTQRELTGNPRDRQARHYLALSLSASGRLFEAIQQLQMLLAGDPQNPELLYQLVVDYRTATQKAGEKLAKLHPDSEFTHAVNGEVYADNQRFDEAILEFKQVLRKNPDFPGIHFALGEVYWRKRDTEHALEQLNLALQQDPNQPLANYYIADILTDRKDYDAAIRHLRVTIPAYPQMAQPYFLLGKCYAGLGKSQEALEAFNKALRIDPNYKEVHYQLYGLYGRLGDNEKSQAHLQTFESLTKAGQDNDKRLLRESYEKQAESKRDN